jgi:hypothetical protein
MMVVINCLTGEAGAQLSKEDETGNPQLNPTALLEDP